MASGYSNEYQERGQTRSGRRFGELNRGYPRSERELLQRHRSLLEPFAGPSTRRFHLASGAGDLLQTTVRYSPSYQGVRGHLRSVFSGLFREHVEARNAGFEVVVTFNVILTNAERTTFSVYYGQDYRATSSHGVHPALGDGSGQPTLVQTLRDVENIPIQFDLDRVVRNLRAAFTSSDVVVHRVLNLVYLIYRFVQG